MEPWEPPGSSSLGSHLLSVMRISSLGASLVATVLPLHPSESSEIALGTLWRS